MPTYSYTCDQCKHQLEAFQGITEKPLELCPQCGQSALKRGIGGGLASFQFKGSGFYKTDYREASSSSDASSASSSCCPCGKNQKDCGRS